MTTPPGAAPRRLTGWPVVALWLGLALGVGLFAATAWLVGGYGLPLPILLVLIASCLSFGGVGAIVATRHPRNAIGWILYASGGVMLLTMAGNFYPSYSLQTAGGGLPGTVAIAVIANVAFVPVLGVVAIYLPLLFPDSHLPSPRWRPVAWLGAVAISLISLVWILLPGPMSGTGVDNPFGVGAAASVETPPTFWIGLVGLGLLAAAVLLAAVSVVVRYRASDQLERRQLRWFGASAAVMIATLAVGSSDIGPMKDLGWIVTVAGMATVPIAVGIAILRYRLYEIDRIISRTLSYAVVTGVLAIVFVGAILLFQTILSPLFDGNAVGVAASTLIVAAMFQPLRRRVQTMLDRRFNRSRYDAQRTVAAFSVRLRDDVDLASLDADIDAVVRQTLAPASLGLWLHAKEGSE